MHSPLSMQDWAHLREASGPLPVRTSSRMPPTMSSEVVFAMPAGSTAGQTSTHLPHRVQASSISSTRWPRAASNDISPLADMTMTRQFVASAPKLAEMLGERATNCRRAHLQRCALSGGCVLQRGADHLRQRLQLERLL